MVIGLCGYRGSGKSEVAKYINKQYKFARVNFKDALVKEVQENFPDLIKAISMMMDRTEYDGNKPWTVKRLLDEKPLLMRTLLQNYGTELRRKENVNYWTDKWLESVKELGGNIVADDVRFFNELSAIVELDGILIRVVRDDVTSGGDHSSEKEQEKFVEDFTIVAKEGELKYLHQQIDQIMAHISAD